MYGDVRNDESKSLSRWYNSSSEVWWVFKWSYFSKVRKAILWPLNEWKIVSLPQLDRTANPIFWNNFWQHELTSRFVRFSAFKWIKLYLRQRRSTVVWTDPTTSSFKMPPTANLNITWDVVFETGLNGHDRNRRCKRNFLEQRAATVQVAKGAISATAMARQPSRVRFLCAHDRGRQTSKRCIWVGFI